MKQPARGCRNLHCPEIWPGPDLCPQETQHEVEDWADVPGATKLLGESPALTSSLVDLYRLGDLSWKKENRRLCHHCVRRMLSGSPDGLLDRQ